MEFNRLLFPVDFSAHSETCLSLTNSLRDDVHVAEVHFLFVLPTPSDFSTWSGDPVADVKQRLDAIVEQVGLEQRIRACAEVRTGHASTEICRYATDHKCDLVVMATHGRTGLAHMLLGSTAEQVVRHAPCPVLTLRVVPH